ncbi:unnamed protein product [Owenia fusiformis]|uniref:phytol kinase n=1 Tax=Owenia fusiformis TaxID=6347 RepID=A0A8J1V088_OWEFU|nr:unnamed protein product [Owenia fusiformis]
MALSFANFGIQTDPNYVKLYARARTGHVPSCLELGKLYIFTPSGYCNDILLGEFYISLAARQGNREAIEILKKIPTLGTSNNDVIGTMLMGSLGHVSSDLFQIQENRLVRQANSHPMNILSSTPRNVLIREMSSYYTPTAENYKKAVALMHAGRNMLVNQPISKRFKRVEGVHLYVDGCFYESKAKEDVPLLSLHGSEIDAFLGKVLAHDPDDFACRYFKCELNSLPPRTNPERLMLSLDQLIRDMEVWMKDNNKHSTRFPNNSEVEEEVVKRGDESAAVQVFETHDIEKLDSANLGGDSILLLNTKILFLVYYTMGSYCVVTHQYIRAIDSFSKALSVYPTSPIALYGVAFATYRREVEIMEAKCEERGLTKDEDARWFRTTVTDILKDGAIPSMELFKQYLAVAPPCDQKYPNVLFLMADVSLKMQDYHGMMNYYERAERAEKERLPIYKASEEGGQPDTEMVRAYYPFIASRLCKNVECNSQKEKILQSPPGKRCSGCKQVRYCSSYCQTEHWPSHKQQCKMWSKLMK